MRCPFETREGQDLLLAYSSGKLGDESKKQIELHVRVCPACGDFVRGQNAVWEALDLWEAPPVPADFDRRLYERIERQVSWWDLMLRPFRPAFRHAVPLAAAAGVLVMAVILLDRPSAVPAPSAHSAQVESLRPDQVEHALAEMEALDQFNRLMRADTSESAPKM